MPRRATTRTAPARRTLAPAGSYSEIGECRKTPENASLPAWAHRRAVVRVRAKYSRRQPASGLLLGRGDEPFELLEPVENDPQFDRSFYCPRRERQKLTSITRRNDPLYNIASCVEWPRLTDTQVWMSLDVGDHN